MKFHAMLGLRFISPKKKKMIFVFSKYVSL